MGPAPNQVSAEAAAVGTPFDFSRVWWKHLTRSFIVLAKTVDDTVYNIDVFYLNIKETYVKNVHVASIRLVDRSSQSCRAQLAFVNYLHSTDSAIPLALDYCGWQKKFWTSIENVTLVGDLSADSNRQLNGLKKKKKTNRFCCVSLIR